MVYTCMDGEGSATTKTCAFVRIHLKRQRCTIGAEVTLLFRTGVRRHECADGRVGDAAHRRQCTGAPDDPGTTAQRDSCTVITST